MGQVPGMMNDVSINLIRASNVSVSKIQLDAGATKEHLFSGYIQGSTQRHAQFQSSHIRIQTPISRHRPFLDKLRVMSKAHVGICLV
jgi:hypothetical protein